MREQESEYITAAKMMKGEDNPAEEDYGDYPMRRFIEGNNKSLGFEELIINLCNDEKRRCSNPPNIFWSLSGGLEVGWKLFLEVNVIKSF